MPSQPRLKAATAPVAAAKATRERPEVQVEIGRLEITVTGAPPGRQTVERRADPGFARRLMLRSS